MADQPSTDRRLFAHIVHPSIKMTDVLNGTKTKAQALCGKFVVRDVPKSAPVCRGCFDEYLRIGEPEDLATGAQHETVSV